jgi:hypothetical protein
MSLPGLLYISKSLPSTFVVPISSYFIQWLIERYLHLHPPRWAVLPVCLLSLPLFFTTKIQYKYYTDRRAAAAHGAIFPPAVPASTGGINLLITAFRDMMTTYP